MSATGLKITNFHYSNMAMPKGDPALSEYPKWLYPFPMAKDGVLVRNAEEEAAYYALKGGETLPLTPAPAVIVQPATVTLAPDNDEKTVLLALAKERNIKVDARWKVAKIRAAMTAAQPQAE